MTIGPPLPAPVVSTQWLADHLGADKLVILDASAILAALPNGKPAYLTGHDAYLFDGHIPGAYFAELIEVFTDPSGPYPFTRPSAELFAVAAASVGVDNNTTVVVYDSAVGQWAARLWWLFRTFGFDRVAVLDGGFKKWTAEERETDIGHVEPPVGSFEVNERPELWVDKAYVERVVSGEVEAALVCGLPPKEFTGEAGYRSRPGHIPGSVSIPASRLVDRDSNAFLGGDALREKFAPVLSAPQVIAYCSAGVASASDALALTLLGYRNVAIFDGSLAEWVADAAAPVVATHEPTAAPA